MADNWQKFHSAVRWGKPVAELEGFQTDVEAADDRNGNRVIHIAAQNGHFEITKWLVTVKKCDVNSQNGKGQTGLHMSVEYDFMKQTAFLLENGAKKDVKNNDGNEAITGIDGGKTGPEAWDAPIQKLRSCEDADSLADALKAIELADPGQIDKGELVKAGLTKKGQLPKGTWDAPRFMEAVKKF